MQFIKVLNWVVVTLKSYYTTYNCMYASMSAPAVYLLQTP